VTSPMPIENPRFIMNQEAMRASRHMALNCLNKNRIYVTSKNLLFIRGFK
jgi:hypothetical protein